MSGGHFNHNQYRIEDIATEIEEFIASNLDATLDDYGYIRGRFYSEETIAKFKEAVKVLRRAAAMAQRIDYLVSGDNSEESFHRRWAEEVECEK